jgi:lipopolysaccharide/colanic/teichoic acid biosynthesis glycosyltransferase
MPDDRAKRWLDLTLAVPALILTLPVQAVVALAVRLRMGSPVLFTQERPGKDGRPFTLLKFRTMRTQDPRRGPEGDADRLTGLGSMLRASSLDEIPSLWNVVRGDMSLVGPRPLLVQYLDRYTPEQARRHEVRPGLTGLAQISGRNALSWEEKLLLDVQYVDRRSMGLDLWIVLRTVWCVLRRQGISAKGDATMPEFRGSAVQGMR